MFTRGIWTTSLSFVPNFVFQAFCLGSVLPDQPRCTQTAPEHGAKPLCFCFHCVHQKKEYSVPITDQVVPRGLSKEAGTQTLDADWKSLKSWLPQNGNKKEGKRCESKAFHQARSACVAVAVPSREIPRIMPGKCLCTSKSVETQVVLESGKRGSEHACRSLTGEKNREITKTPGARWRRSVLVSMTYGKVRRTAYL